MDTQKAGPPFAVLSICKGGGYRYCRTSPPHPRANANGLYPLHRVLAENKLGRLLDSSEHVHHEDEDKSNDDPSNLRPMSRSEHGRLHKPLIERVKCVCPTCGNAFELRPNVFRLRTKRSLTGRVVCSFRCIRRGHHSTARIAV